MGRLTGACVAASPPWYAEPLDRLERSSPGYGPGTSPSTLERQRSAVISPGDRRLADVRHAVCQRGILPPPTKARASRRIRRLPVYEAGAFRNDLDQPSGVGDRVSKLQGSESNRRGPAYEAGSGANPPCREQTEHAAGIEPASPAWKAGASLQSATRAFASAQRESNPLLRTGKPACGLEHLGREIMRVEGGNRTRACTELQSVALPSWRPRQVSEPARDSVHHRSPGLAHSEETERVELSERVRSPA